MDWGILVVFYKPLPHFLIDLLKAICLPQECPSGVVNEETFKHIYAQFFPHGGKEQHFPFSLML